MRRTTTKLLALGTAAALGLAACGDDEVTPAQSGVTRPAEASTSSVPEGDAAGDEESPPTTDDAASTLRTELTALLQEHAFLTGMALEAVVDTGGADDPDVEPALSAVADNSQSIANVVASLPTAEDREGFLEPWEAHVEALIDYAVARVGGDGDAADEAMAGFVDFQQSTADLLDELTDGEIGSDDIFGDLETYVTSMTALVDTMVTEFETEQGDEAGAGGEAAASDGDSLTQLRDAASQLTTLAATIADGFVAAHPEEYPGNPLSIAADTRAELTAALQEHVYLAGVAVEQLVETRSTTAPATQRATDALDDSAVDLANAVGAIGGNDRRAVFLDLWRTHASSLLDHAAAQIGAGDDGAAAATELQSFPAAGGAFFEELTTGNISAGEVTEGLEAHVTAMLDVVDRFVADEPGAVTDLEDAAEQVRPVADGLARAVMADRAPEEGDEDDDTASTDGGTADAGGSSGIGSGGTGETGEADSGAGDSGDGGGAQTETGGAGADDAGSGM